MSNMIASLAHRYLRRRLMFNEPMTGAVGWRDVRDEPEIAALFSVPGEDLIGVYENNSGVDPPLVIVTSIGLRFRQSSVAALEFANIEETRPPLSKTEGPREIEFALRGGLVRRLPITRAHGDGGKFQDVYAFNLFMRGVLRHLVRRR